MKYFIKQTISFIILLLTICSLLANTLHAVPMTINYQGHLTDTQGIMLDNVSVRIVLKIFDAQTGGKQLWSEIHPSITVTKGVFNIVLGESEPLAGILAKDNLYLSISVEEDPEMLPRQKLASAVFAMRAGVAESVVDGSITTEKIADGAITASKIHEDAMPYKNGVSAIQVKKPNFTPEIKEDYFQIFARSPGIDFFSNSPLVDGIVLFWKMDDSNISEVFDSAHLDHAAAFNHPEIVQGKIGNARKFDANKNQYLMKNNDSDLDFDKGSFTVSFWMKAEKPAEWAVIMSKANNWGDDINDYGWLFGNNEEGSADLQFRINSNGEGKRKQRVITADNVFNNEWHHIVGVRDETTILLYVDGKLKETKGDVVQTTDVNKPFVVGGLTDYYFSGLIDELAIWNRALTEISIAELYTIAEGRVPCVDGGLYILNAGGGEDLINGVWKKNGEHIFSDKNIGIGKSEPEAKLDIDGNVNVSGSIEMTGILKVGGFNECNLNLEGAIRYNSEQKMMEFCNGKQWGKFYNPPPKAPEKIIGDRIVCSNFEEKYSVETVESGTSYEWIVPSGATIVQGEGTESITVNFARASSGDICVAAKNINGKGDNRCTTINIHSCDSVTDSNPPEGWKQCAGFINTTRDDTNDSAFNGCLNTNRLRIRVWNLETNVLEEDVYSDNLNHFSLWPDWNYLGGEITKLKSTNWKGKTSFFATNCGQGPCSQNCGYEAPSGMTLSTGDGSNMIIAPGNIDEYEIRMTCNGPALLNRKIIIYK